MCTFESLSAACFKFSSNLSMHFKKYSKEKGIFLLVAKPCQRMNQES